jgi:hypothetical protein
MFNGLISCLLDSNYFFTKLNFNIRVLHDLTVFSIMVVF